MKYPFVLILLVATCVWCSKTYSQKPRQPNIVFIFSDDLSFRDLHAYGQSAFTTPNLDALAAVSTRFTQAYAPAPECAPSRACMLTGVQVGRSPIRINSSARGFEYLSDTCYTFAHMLQKAGYVTGVIGKWGLGNKGTAGFALNQGFDYQFGYQSHYEAHSYFPWKLYENGVDIPYKGNQSFDMTFLYDKKDEHAPNDSVYEAMYTATGQLIRPHPANRVYAPDVMDQKALAFIEKHRKHPFFLYFTTNLPHGPTIVDDMRQLSSRKDMHIHSREWGAMVQRLDMSVGKLIEKLKKEGLYENTLIIFASDNGYAMHHPTNDPNGKTIWPDDPYLHNKGPFYGGKFTVREAGMRIPFFIHYPGQSQPKAVAQPVWLVDLFPTFADIAAQKVTRKLDGYSLLPLLQGKASTIPYERSFYFFKNNEQAVRKGAWYGFRTHPSEPLQLYLLDEDQTCSYNLASTYPSVVKDLETILRTSHVPHPWYWNPGETQQNFEEKRKKAAASGQKLDEYRPNGMTRMPWEK